MRLNFRLRTLMLATAVVGVAAWGIIGMATERRRAYYRQRVDSFAFGEADVLEQIAEKLMAAHIQLGRTEPGVQLLRGWLERHSSLDLLDAVARKSKLTEPEARALGDSIKKGMAAKYPKDKVPGS